MSNREYLNAPDGLILGIDQSDQYLSLGGYQHVMLMAPTGTGKGISMVVPNLLNWAESVIVHDVKLENYKITSGWRAAQGNKIYLFDPLNAEGQTNRYNPLDFISSKPDQMFDDIQKMANLLLSDHELRHTPARNLFIGLVSYIVADLSKLKTFGEIYRMLMGNLVEDLTQGLNVLSIHAGAIMLIKSFLGKSEKERAAITTNLASHLEIWGNPLIDKATSCSDFNPINFRKEKSTLYVGLRPCDINRLRPLMRFFYQHIAQTLTLTTPDENTEPHGILFLLDEFPTLGHMNIFTTCIPYFRGYKIRLFIVTQDLNDLQSSYGESGANTLLANCNFKVAFTPNNWETAKLIADLSITSQPEVLMRMKSDQQIFIIDGDYPLICRKMIYFSRVEFRDKLMEAVKLEFKN